MLFRRAVLDAIAAGEADLAFRRWERPRVKVGSRLRTAVGVLEVVAVDRVPDEAVTADEAARAGARSVAAVLAAGRTDRPLFRVQLRLAGADPRVALRANVPDGEELRALQARLDAIDARSRRGPWTRSVLALIAERPATLAAELAAATGRERLAFKRDVRVLKELGLTESLPKGYRLSPRGEAVLAARHVGPAPG
jgi:hypothetical protein